MSHAPAREPSHATAREPSHAPARKTSLLAVRRSPYVSSYNKSTCLQAASSLIILIYAWLSKPQFHKLIARMHCILAIILLTYILPVLYISDT